MSYEYGINDIYILGTLISEEKLLSYDKSGRRRPIWINSNNKLQFNIEPISELPDSFPEIKYFDAFASNFKVSEFDEFSFEYSERVSEFKMFLDKYLIVFKPFRSKSEHNKLDDTSLTLIRKDTIDFIENTFYRSVPIFKKNEMADSREKFEQMLIQNRFFGGNASISKDKNDVPEFVLWRDENRQYTAYGIIDGFDYDKTSGFCLTSGQNIKSVKLSAQWLAKSIYNDQISTVMFINISEYKEISAAIENEGVELKSKIDFVNQPKVLMPKTVNIVKSNSNIQENPECEFVRRFIEYTHSELLTYDNKDLVNFHIAMKSSNLVILAGMSGSGKSRLVSVYGNSLGIPAEQMKFIPVRPAWADDSDILGYLDTLNMIYRPADTGLVDTLISASKYQDSLYIVCFDEMNLARVEHYFSQFLSVLEQENNKKYLQLYNEKVENRVYNSNEYPARIEIGENIIFVGTVNIDESTYHFSDKVLDRANVITLKIRPFNELKEIVKREREKKEQSKSDIEKKKYSFSVYKTFKITEEFNLEDSEIEFLTNLHNLLQRQSKNFGIGFRIVRQIHKYLSNINDLSVTRREMFDMQIVQRIMTKIRGSQDLLENLTGSYNEKDNSTDDSEFIKLLDSYKNVSDFIETRQAVINKARELKMYGYTI